MRMSREEKNAKARKRMWEWKHKGEIYPGPFTPEELSKKASDAKRKGLEDVDCPTIVPGSKTEQVIIGSLLGDGYLIKTGQFGEGHCSAQLEVVEELARLLEPLWTFMEKLTEIPRLRIKTHKSRYHLETYGVEEVDYYIRTPDYPIFHLLRKLWYPEGKKIVPDEILDKMGPQALAWWYMGDGVYLQQGHHLQFSSQGFTHEDNQKLCGVFIKLGLNSVKITNSNKIRLDHKDTDKFLPLIAEYVVPTLRYKLGPLEPTYKPYNTHHYDPEHIITERMWVESKAQKIDKII